MMSVHENVRRESRDVIESSGMTFVFVPFACVSCRACLLSHSATDPHGVTPSIEHVTNHSNERRSYVAFFRGLRCQTKQATMEPTQVLHYLRTDHIKDDI